VRIFEKVWRPDWFDLKGIWDRIWPAAIIVPHLTCRLGIRPKPFGRVSFKIALLVEISFGDARESRRDSRDLSI